MKKIIFLLIVLIFLVGCAKQNEILSKGVSSDEKATKKKKIKTSESETSKKQENKTENTDAARINATYNETLNETLNNSDIMRTEQTNLTNTQNENLNKTEMKIEKQEHPETYNSCRNSAILYGGCRWNDLNKEKFELEIMSASHLIIPSIWFVIKGENKTKYIERTEDLVPEATRIYNISYIELKNELGSVVKFDVLPVEIINGTEYMCYNQRTSFIPTSHCKLPAIKMN